MNQEVNRCKRGGDELIQMYIGRLGSCAYEYLNLVDAGCDRAGNQNLVFNRINEIIVTGDNFYELIL